MPLAAPSAEAQSYHMITAQERERQKVLAGEMPERPDTSAVSAAQSPT